MKRISRKVIGWICLALVCVLAGTVIGAGTLNARAEEEKKVVVTSPFTEAIAKARGSVVGVNNYQIVNYGGNDYGGYGGYYFPWGSYGYGQDPWGGSYGWGGQSESEEVKYGSGSGVVVAEGYVLTNYHVVEGAHSLKVSVNNEETKEPELYDATVAAYDADKDVAVLYVPDLKLPPVELGDSDTLQLGDWAICIGNPLGFEGTVTAGIVSGLDREIKSGTKTTDKYGRKTESVNRMIQTDAAINSGNSGGGMFNTEGQLVGIPTLKYSGSRYTSGASIESIGMCIPINEAKDVITAALNGEKPAAETPEEGKDEGRNEQKEGQGDLTGKPRMGVTVRSWQGASYSNGQWPNGVLVMAVEKDGPADEAGLKAGDMIIEIDGTVISGSEDMMNLLRGKNEGDEVKVKYFRPDEVGNIEEYEISLTGSDAETTVKLAVVDSTIQ